MLAGDDGRDAEEFVIHELINSAQTELGCVDDSRESRFRWLMEGMAVYGAREAQVSSGRRRAADTDAYIRSAGGVAAQREFCAAVGQGREWRAAFTGAFGLSPAAFYAEFERSRR